MRLSEVESEIKKNNLLRSEVNKQLSTIQSRNEYLETYKEGLIINYFSDYIELNQEVEISNRSIRVIMGVDGSVLDLEDGDKIEIVKKNKKTFLVKVDKKIYFWDKTTGVSVISSKKVEGLYRIGIIDLYKCLINSILSVGNSAFKDKFNTYVKRRESIDLIID